eukprot:CAMPEP_0116954514 /NCGR_PEP_ID=MMETSP0467-20121206/41998_1 /TAXON_ID=283647 /ORGANISM="Mesodinium pulex, Strain SPMC105" /LENGTH=70 /DNA_ID=CAMNT_0004640241 /DNA_START=231 /DNA_END=443 /DNA_ORIENTATION=+
MLVNYDAKLLKIDKKYRSSNLTFLKFGFFETVKEEEEDGDEENESVGGGLKQTKSDAELNLREIEKTRSK